MPVNSNNKNKPCVSVIMPAFNADRTIKDAIDSIVSQTFQDFELIVCDDASTDGTQKAINGISDTRIVYLKNASNLGSGMSRNRAIRSAQGKWLAFTDADDIWMPERLDKLLAAANPADNVMVFDDIWECHDTPDGMRTWRRLRGKLAFDGNGSSSVDVPLEKFLREKRLLIKPLVPLKFVIQNKLLHSSRLFGEDTEFFLKLTACGMTLRFVPEPMYLYRITPYSASSIFNHDSMMKEVLENMKPHFSHSPTVQNAIHVKISMLAKDEQYMPFVVALKKKQFVESFKLAYHSPWLVKEFLSRLQESVPYHLHRILHGGRARGMR